MKSEHSLMSKLSILLSAFCLNVTHGEKEGNTYHPVISWTAPLDTLDFENWSFEMSSVALQNKLVLNPNGHERYGFIDNHFVSDTLPHSITQLFDGVDLPSVVVGNEH